MNSFAASRKWSGDSEWVFTNWLNFRPTSMGKHNFMGHLLPCAIDSKTNHPPVYLQWIGKFVMSTEPHHVISIGPRQPEVPGERAKNSICVSQCQSIKITPKNMYIAWARAQFKIKTHRCAFQTVCQLSIVASDMPWIVFFTQFLWHGTYALNNRQLAVLPQSGDNEFDLRSVHDNSSVPLWVYMRFPVSEHHD